MRDPVLSKSSSSAVAFRPQTVGTVRDGEPRAATSTYTQLLTSTETVGTVRDGEPRAATSTYTQLLTSERGSFLSFFRGASRPQKQNYGLLGTWEEWDRQ